MKNGDSVQGRVDNQYGYGDDSIILWICLGSQDFCRKVRNRGTFVANSAHMQKQMPCNLPYSCTVGMTCVRELTALCYFLSV